LKYSVSNPYKTNKTSETWQTLKTLEETKRLERLGRTLKFYEELTNLKLVDEIY